MDWTFWEILSYFTKGTRYIMVKTLISLISNIKVKGGRGEIKNTSMDKKKAYAQKRDVKPEM